MRDGDDIVFSEFDFDVTPEGGQKEFRFSAANYDAVCKSIAELARERHERNLAGHS